MRLSFGVLLFIGSYFLCVLSSVQLFGEVCFYCNKPCRGEGALLSPPPSLPHISTLTSPLSPPHTLTSPLSPPSHPHITTLSPLTPSHHHSLPPHTLTEVTVLNKTWCLEHFRCAACNSVLTSPR